MARSPGDPDVDNNNAGNGVGNAGVGNAGVGNAGVGNGERFEELLKKLEAVVLRLERGDLSLEDSLKAYEEGIALVRAAQGRLDGMDKRLEQLLADGRTAPMPPPPEE